MYNKSAIMTPVARLVPIGTACDGFARTSYTHTCHSKGPGAANRFFWALVLTEVSCGESVA